MDLIESVAQGKNHPEVTTSQKKFKNPQFKLILPISQIFGRFFAFMG
jgi:hypothetical protein